MSFPLTFPSSLDPSLNVALACPSSYWISKSSVQSMWIDDMDTHRKLICFTYRFIVFHPSASFSFHVHSPLSRFILLQTFSFHSSPFHSTLSLSFHSSPSFYSSPWLFFLLPPSPFYSLPFHSIPSLFLFYSLPFPSSPSFNSTPYLIILLPPFSFYSLPFHFSPFLFIVLPPTALGNVGNVIKM